MMATYDAPTGLATAAQSSARADFATTHLTERYFSTIVRSSHKKTAYAVPLFFSPCPCRAKLAAFALSTNVISPQSSGANEKTTQGNPLRGFA